MSTRQDGAIKKKNSLTRERCKKRRRIDSSDSDTCSQNAAHTTKRKATETDETEGHSAHLDRTHQTQGPCLASMPYVPNRAGTSSELPSFNGVRGDVDFGQSLRRLLDPPPCLLTLTPTQAMSAVNPNPYTCSNAFSVTTDVRLHQDLTMMALQRASFHGNPYPTFPFWVNPPLPCALPLSLPYASLSNPLQESLVVNPIQAIASSSEVYNDDRNGQGGTSSLAHSLTSAPDRNDAVGRRCRTTKASPAKLLPGDGFISRTANNQTRKTLDRVGENPTLYIPDDRGKLNDNQIFLRQQIELFRATEGDILSLTRGKNKPIALGQVGIRCRHCSRVAVGRRKKGSTYFPSNLLGIYQAAQNLSVDHLQSGLCTELPLDIKERFAVFKSGTKPQISGAGKTYWAEAGRMLGLVDTEDGIRFQQDLRETDAFNV